MYTQKTQIWTQIVPYFLIFWCEKNVHEALSFCILKRIKGIGGVGVWVLGVRLRKEALTRREIRILAQLGLGVAPRFLQKVRAQAPKF